MSPEEARDQGALGTFGEKYGKKITVYSIGNFSKEICTGPHVKNTREIGFLKIKKESSSSAGVRRIKAVLEKWQNTFYMEGQQKDPLKITKSSSLGSLTN